MALIDFALWLQRDRDRTRALELERHARAAALPSAGDPAAAALAALDVPGGVRIGHHVETGRGLRVDLKTLARSAVIPGASGAGKTVGLVSIIDQILRRVFGVGLPAGVTEVDLEIELIDPKSETYRLVCLALAILYEGAPPEVQERIERSVQVITSSRDRVSPFCPYDNDGSVSDSFHAHLRASVAGTAGSNPDTPGVQQLRFMVDRVLTELRFAPNYRLLARFFTDPAFQARIVGRVSDRDVRAFFENLQARMSRQTIEAYLRRVQKDLSFPEVKLALGCPPDRLRRILPKTKPKIILADFGPEGNLPAGVCLERASHHVTDSLRWAARRDPSVPKVLVIEEAPTLIAGATALTEPLSVAGRTLRSVNYGVLYVAQDFVGGLPPDLVRTVALNAYWQAVFRSGKGEAEWIYGHVADSDGAPETERRAFLKRIEGLPDRHFYFLQKGRPAVALKTDDVAPVSAERQAELLDLFDRKIAVKSTISAAVAAEIIAEFEAEVVDQGAIPPGSPAAKATSVGGFGDLLRALGGDREDPDAE